MSIPNIFVPNSVYIKTAGGVDTWIDAIQSSEMQEGIELMEESGSGEIAREFISMRSRLPMLPLETLQITKLTTISPLVGIFISPASGALGVKAWGKYMPLGSGPDAIANTTHLLCTITDGQLVPISLRASQGQAARLSLMIHAILGSTATYTQARPMIFTKDQAITSGQAQMAELYTLGAVKYTISGGASVLITGLTDMGVNFGLQVAKEMSDGEVDATHICIAGQNPVFDFTTKDGDRLADVGEDGRSLSAFDMYFQKCDKNGLRVPKATAQHVKVSCTDGMLTPGSLRAQHKQSANASFTFTPSKPSGGNIIAVVSNAAIPTS